MTPTITWSVVLLLILVRVAAGIYWNRRLRQVELAGEIRNELADVRRRAVRLLADGELKPDSQTFFFLYIMPSFLVRRAHAYPRVAHELFRGVEKADFRRGSQRLNAVRVEAYSWSPEVQQLWLDLVERVDRMARTFVWEIAALSWLERNILRIPWMRAIVASAYRWRARRDGRAHSASLELHHTSRETAGWTAAA